MSLDLTDEGMSARFQAIRNKRMSELTPEQQDDALELWLREQIGWMPEYHRQHYTFLLNRLNAARRTIGEVKAEKPVIMPAEVIEQNAFEEWLKNTRPTGDAEQVHREWLDSVEYQELGLPPNYESIASDAAALLNIGPFKAVKDAMLEEHLQKRDYPSNPHEAARAGWDAAFDWIRTKLHLA